jgi:hypothetical protein
VRRIILLMTGTALVVVSTLFVVSASGAHKQPTAKAHKHPIKRVLIQDFRFKPAHITIKRERGSDGSTGTALRTPPRRTTEERLTPDVWVRTEVFTHLQERGEEEILLQDTSPYEGKRPRQALAVDEGKRSF